MHETTKKKKTNRARAIRVLARQTQARASRESSRPTQVRRGPPKQRERETELETATSRVVLKTQKISGEHRGIRLGAYQVRAESCAQCERRTEIAARPRSL